MKHFITNTNPMRPQFHAMAAHQAKHFSYAYDAGVVTITLNRPERKNPLTFDSYAELRDLFHALELANDVKAVVLTGAGGNFCSGGDVHEIIGPLTQMTMPEMLEFTRMTGNLIKAMRLSPQPIIAAIDGICAGAGAHVGACALLPRLIGQGRASELLFSGRSMSADEGLQWGFFNALHEPDQVLAAAQTMAKNLASGPTFAHGMTKTMLHQEWAMTLDQALEAEAQAQAICMQTQDFKRAFDAFAAKQTPVFGGD